MKLQDFLTEGRGLVFRRPLVSSQSIIVQVEHERGRSKIWTKDSIRQVKWFYLDEEGAMHEPVLDQADSSGKTPKLRTRPDTTVLVVVGGHCFSIPFLRQHDYLLDTETKLRLATEIREGDKIQVIDADKRKERPATPEYFIVYEGPVVDFRRRESGYFIDVGSGREIDGLCVDLDGQTGPFVVMQVFGDTLIPVDMVAAIANCPSKHN